MTAPAGQGRDGTPPRPSAAADRPRQRFIFGPWVFDVTAATGLLRGAPRPAQPLPVQQWARAYGLDPAPAGPHTVSLIGPGPGFDPVYAMTTDLNEPVIIATLTGPDGAPAGPLLIDGCHRLYKAARLGLDELAAFVLTAGETLAIRYDAALGPARPRHEPRTKAITRGHSARNKETAPMTDRLSQRPVPPLDPPEEFAGGEVVAAVRCPVDISTNPRRHVIVVRHAGDRQTFSVHEVTHNHVEWSGGQGHYDLGYADALRRMVEKAVGQA